MSSRSSNMAKGEVDTGLMRTGTGIHTVEGNVAGARAARLTKQRDADMAAYAAKKKKVADDIQKGARGMDDRFNTASLEFKGQAIGLMTKEEFAMKSALEDAPSLESQAAAKAAADAAEKKEKLKKKKEKKRALATLSFGGGDEDEEEGSGGGGGGQDSKSQAISAATTTTSFKKMKNPNAATAFLPDRDRELAAARRREELKAEWLVEQERIKGEKLEVTYSYWDGSGHRRTITVTKGQTIGKFLEAVRLSISADFHELRTMSAESLLYIKEDLIIPSHFSFYDLIVTKARGKSGPLFHFDVHDDVRLNGIDARVEKDESHPGKIVQRGWYERNKHIFPASRWETYDPNVKRESYTIHGGEVDHEK